MRSIRTAVLLSLTAILVGMLTMIAALRAEAQATPPAKHVRIDVVAEADAVAAGGEIWIALRERIDPEWHTYWINPGDSGDPTTIKWQLPPGFTASDIHWPLPEAIPVGPLTNYGFSDEVLLLARLSVPKDTKPGPVTVQADAEWLVCKDICVPESGSAKLELTVLPAGEAARPGAGRDAIEAARRNLPKPSPWSAEFATSQDTIELRIAGAGESAAAANPYFFSLKWGAVQHAAKQAAIRSGDDLILRLTRGDEKGAIDKLDGVLVLEQGAGADKVRQGFSISAMPGAFQVTATPASGQSGEISSQTGGGVVDPAQIGLAKALIFALLGGVILNLMPCVFPVLSLKALAFAKSRDESHVNQGLGYFAGVMVSFAVLAGVLLAIRGVGSSLGWGFQFQSPVFVLLLAAVFFGLGLSLSGVFSLGGSITGLGDELTRRSGIAGSFFTGMLATIAATPCTAPFMGAAIGFAIAAPAPALIATLLAMGVGFAAPALALAMSPRLVSLLPKPGPWMETFKQVIAFPLYATAAWLVWVLSLQAGSEGVLAAMVVGVGIAFAGWLAGRGEVGFDWRKIAAAVIALTAFGIGAQTVQSELGPVASGQAPAGVAAQSNVALPEIAFSRERIAELRAAGRTVFVNMTAAWCISCKVNEKVALTSDRIRAVFAKENVAYVKGDWTRQDAHITEFLRSFGRAGVPLYVVYPPGEGEPRVLPQLLTESIVIDAVMAASGKSRTGSN